MNKYWKIFIPSLIALAAILFVVQIKYHPLGSHTTITHIADSGDDSLADYYQTAQQLAPQNQTSTTTVTFLAVGDINLSRNVASQILEKNNVDYPFLGMAAILKSTDFNFANLESPIAPAGKQIIGGNSLIFGAPIANAQGLKDYNFQIVNSANNHAFDQGLSGIDLTRSTLDALGIAHEGTGDNLDQAWIPAVAQARGLLICFIGASFSSINDGGKVTNNYLARIEDVDRLKSSIKKAKAECDFTVVTMHAGIEYTRMPNQAQITFAHSAIDDGADIVICAHPHWPQTIEKYCPMQSSPPAKEKYPAPAGVGGMPQSTTTPSAAQPPLLYQAGSTATCANPKYIFYSLGNFIFDQGWSQDTSEGLTLKITLSKQSCSQPINGLSQISTADKSANYTCSDSLQGQRQPAHLDSIELLPIIITNSQPHPATGDETKSILQKIGQTESMLK